MMLWFSSLVGLVALADAASNSESPISRPAAASPSPGRSVAPPASPSASIRPQSSTGSTVGLSNSQSVVPKASSLAASASLQPSSAASPSRSSNANSVVSPSSNSRTPSNSLTSSRQSSLISASKASSSNSLSGFSRSSASVPSASASITSRASRKYDCDGWCFYSFTGGLISHPSATAISTTVVTTTAYAVPVTYRLPNGQLLSTTYTYANANATVGAAAQEVFQTPKYAQPTFTWGFYTLTAPTTYYAIATGGINGYLKDEPVDKDCDKKKLGVDINLSPVPSIEASIDAEKSSAFAYLTNQADPVYCTTWRTNFLPGAFPTLLNLLPPVAQSPNPTATIAPGAVQGVAYTSASVVTKVLPGQTSDVAQPPAGFAIPNGNNGPPQQGGGTPLLGPAAGQQNPQPGSGGQQPAGQDQQNQAPAPGQNQQQGGGGLVGNIVDAIIGGQQNGQGSNSPNNGQGGNSPNNGQGGSSPNNGQGGNPPNNGQGGNGQNNGQQGGQQGGQNPFGPVVIGGQVVTPLGPGAGVVVNGQTIQVGNTATIAGGIPVVVGSGGSINVNGQAATIGAQQYGQGSPVTINGAAVTPLAGGSVVVNGNTIGSGGSATLANGQVVSVGPAGNVVVVNGQTATIAGAGSPNQPNAVTVNGAQITPLPNGAVVVSGTTILPNNAVTLANGQVVSLASGGSAIVVNGVTTQLPGVQAASAVTVGSATITRAPDGSIVVGSRTLTAGQAITLSNGQVVSAGTSGTFVVDGTTTSLAAASSGSISTSSNSTTTSSSLSSTRSPGEAIASGIGATKKGDANSPHLGHGFSPLISFEFILGIIAYLAGLW